jgi:diaminohydroxyphosphoribosylaminopyrimidine deaminase/5-amino-6-(5-phosphoribosylamino)uracil reductase
MEDPNPSVSGRGIRALRRAGIETTVGCLHDEAHRLNEIYSHWIKTGRPFLILKTAMTLDGKIATAGGESRWITGDAARRHVHRLRSRVDAIMVGMETVLSDDPQLTVRLAGRGARLTNGHQPLRVVLDSRLRIPPTARVLTPLPGAGAAGRTLIATTAKAPRRRIEKLRAQGTSVLVLPSRDGKVSLDACLRRLGQMGVSSVLLEGGSQMNASALRAGLVNRVVLYVAPLLLGGQDAKGVIGGPSPKRLSGAVRLTNLRIRRLGDDLLIEGNPRNPRLAGS